MHDQPSAGEIINNAIGIVIGIYVTLIGFRVIGIPGKQTNEARDAWFARWGKFFRIAGPLMIVIASLITLHSIFRGR